MNGNRLSIQVVLLLALLFLSACQAGTDGIEGEFVRRAPQPNR